MEEVIDLTTVGYWHNFDVWYYIPEFIWGLPVEQEIFYG